MVVQTACKFRLLEVSRYMFVGHLLKAGLEEIDFLLGVSMLFWSLYGKT